MLHNFFSTAAIDGLPLVQGEHKMGLVVLSIVVAVFMSLMALETAHIARYSASLFYQRIALITGAIALAAGIWSTHFIGMLAFVLPAPIDYRADLTMLSFVPALVASTLAMNILARPKFTHQQLIIGGTIIGLGIALMHYLGMMAMVTPLVMLYDPWVFALSVALAVLVSIAALTIRFRLGLKLPKKYSFYLSAILFGLAIAAMHYTALAATEFYGVASPKLSGIMIEESYIALALSSLCITAGGMVAALNGLIRTSMFYRTMEENKSRVQAILDTAVDAIITIDGQGKVQEFNKSAERLFGYQAIEVVGHNVKMLMPEPYHSEHDGYLSNYRETQRANIIGIGREVVARRKDGSTLPVRLAVGKVAQKKADDLLFVGMLSDISERHALEGSLREAAERAEQAAQAKSNFLANMSHEIRTPMNAIIGFTDLLLHTELTPTQKEHLQTIKRSSSSLLSLINDILDTTKIEQGYLELENNVFSMPALIQQILATLNLSAQSKGLHLHTDYPESTPKFFIGDSLRIAQILTNLIGNAIKFTEQGTVSIKLNYANDNVRIQVKDTGIGMTPEQVSSIFEPFTQADSSISRRFGGSGLGTTISRQLAETMGGTIEVETELGQGSNFCVTLPLRVADQPVPQKQAEQAVQLPKLKLLIADDVEQNLQLLRLILEREGHEVFSARNGQEVIEQYQTDSFDLVLMDLHMPIIDGLQACATIRSNEQQHNLKRTPIIALTASVMERDRDEARQAGMDGFAVKPLDVPQLFAEMCRVLKPTNTLAEPIKAIKAKTIDWHTGENLWGSRQELVKQISSFLETAAKQYPQLHGTAESIDLDALLFNLHSLRGVTGNLGLNALSKKTAELEHMLKTDQQQQALQQLPELNALFAAIQTELQTWRVENDNQAKESQSTTRTNQPVTQIIEQLLVVLKRNELDNQLLETLYQNLETEQTEQLRTAIDSFEFDQACACLEQLLRD